MSAGPVQAKVWSLPYEGGFVVMGREGGKGEGGREEERKTYPNPSSSVGILLESCTAPCHLRHHYLPTQDHSPSHRWTGHARWGLPLETVPVRSAGS